MSNPPGPVPSSSLLPLREALRREALSRGFPVVRFAPPGPPPHSGALLPWLAAGHHGGMAWMARHTERRLDPAQLLPGLGAVMVVGCNYRPPGDPLAYLAHPGRAGISAYARNRDYHDLLKKRLKGLARWLEAQVGHPLDGRLFVDTAPVLEKPLGAACGAGWQGKNTMLVNRCYGNWLFLGELFTTLPLPPDPPEPDRCGRCTRCLDACPTDALAHPYRLDASRCLAYFTIESSAPIPRRYRRAMGNRLYGCDDCVAVCPWNRFAPLTEDPDFLPRPVLDAPQLLDFVHLDEAGFRALFSGSPIKRSGVGRFLRNLGVALGNWGEAPALAALATLLEHASPLVRGHAAWGLGELAPRHAQARETLQQRLTREDDPGVREELALALGAGGAGDHAGS